MPQLPPTFEGKRPAPSRMASGTVRRVWTVALCVWAVKGCKNNAPPAVAAPLIVQAPDGRAANLERNAPAAIRDGGGDPGAVAPGGVTDTDAAKPTISTAVREIDAHRLIAILRQKKELRALTPDALTSSASAGGPLAGLVPHFTETTRDDADAVWEFSGENQDGFVRAVGVTFHMTRSNTWVFHSVSVHVHSDPSGNTFDDVRRAALATLRKPRWMDLGGRGRTAWSLGDGWDLILIPLEMGDIKLRSGFPTSPNE